jgi:hypothetical protein
MLAWPDSTKAAYVACALDTDGWISLRTHSHKDGYARISCNAGVTNQSIEFLERIAALCGVPPHMTTNGKPGRDSRGIITRAPCYQSYWRSPLHVVKILRLAMPYLVAKRERAEYVLEFAERRIVNGVVQRRHKPYTERDWQLLELVVATKEPNMRTAA